MIKFLRKISRILPVALLCGATLTLTSCFNDDDTNEVKYKEWREQNKKYIDEAEAKTNADGSLYYTKITPSWAPDAYVLMHWHNDRALTEKNLSPMDNSTTQITYELFDINNERISDSFNNPDSLYTSRPSQNIIGMWTALTHMNVGDSVTIVMPSQSGYGEYPSGKIPPYSTLVYNVKLKAITAYEIP